MSKKQIAESDEWFEWYRMSPTQRWHETDMLWDFYLSTGGSLDPEPDTQSPFYAVLSSSKVSSHGRAGMHIVRRS